MAHSAPEDGSTWSACVTQLEDRRERVAVISHNGTLLRVADAISGSFTSSTSCHVRSVYELQLGLVTGRTHQIRASLALEQCPVWGDFWYGFPNRFGFDPMVDPPIALRASELSFPDTKGNLLHFRIP
jgi:23S rRNA-/tRNA-specific pseudouridylate synthase